MANRRMVRSGNHAITIWAFFRRYHPNFSGSAIQGHRVLKGLATKGLCVNVLTAGDQEALGLRGRIIDRDGLRVHYLSTIRRRDWEFLARLKVLRRLVTYLNSLASSLSYAIC